MGNIKTEIKWAIIFSLVSLAWMLLEKLSGLHDKYLDYQMYLTLLFFIPAVWVYVLALKDKREKDFSGSFTYVQGLKSGIILSVFIALLSPLTQWVTTYVITPEYFPNVIQRSVELGYYDSIEAAEQNFNYKNYAIHGMIFAFIAGVLTSLVVMIFLRNKKEKPVNNTM